MSADRDPVEASDAASEGRTEAAATVASGLAVYGYPQCPFCQRVLRAIDALGLDVPLLDTLQDPDRRRELVEAMGRGTVPVLRIEDETGAVEWLPESSDIVRYLNERFGRPA